MTTVISKQGASVYPIIVPTKKLLGTYNFFLYQEGDSLSLIDAGIDTDECWEEFVRVMNHHGFTLSDIDRIILTHHHSDHVGLVNRIIQLKEIPVYAHSEAIPRLKMDQEFLSMRLGFFEQLYQEMGCGAASEQHVQKLKESLEASTKGLDKREIQADILQIAPTQKIGGLQAVEALGHAPNQLIFFDEQRNWLFGGDLLLSHISSNAIVEPDGDATRLPTLVQHVDSLEKCSALDVDVLFPGHQQLIYNHQELITMRLNKTNEKAERILNLIKSGISTANDLAESYYKSKYRTQFALVISEIVGQLDYLETNRKIDKQLKDGVWHYAPA